MDIGDLALHALVSIVSAAAGVSIAAWKISRELQETKSTANEAKKKAEKVETSLEVFAKEQGDSWRQMDRTLGQIEGHIGATPPTNPRKSRPGQI